MPWVRIQVEQSLFPNINKPLIRIHLWVKPTHSNINKNIWLFCYVPLFFDKMENLLKLFGKIKAQWSREFIEYTNNCVNQGRENVLGCLPNNSNCVHKTRHLVRIFHKHCRQIVDVDVDFQNCSLGELILFLRIGFCFPSKEEYKFSRDLIAFCKRMMSEDCYCPHCKPKCWKR